MKVESIAECSKWSILQYVWPALSDNRYWKPILLFFERSFSTGFTVHVYCTIITVLIHIRPNVLSGLILFLHWNCLHGFQQTALPDKELIKSDYQIHFLFKFTMTCFVTFAISYIINNFFGYLQDTCTYEFKWVPFINPLRNMNFRLTYTNVRFR